MSVKAIIFFNNYRQRHLGNSLSAFTVKTPDVKAVQEKTGLSQAMFATMIGVKVKTLQNWEQHRRNPTGAAAALLTIFDREPERAKKALHGAS